MGRVTGVKTPAGDWTDYQYNNLGQLTKVPGYINERPEYDNGGLLVGIKTVNGVYNSFDYDYNGRLTSLNYNSQNNVLKTYAITYDGANNITELNNNSYQYEVYPICWTQRKFGIINS